MLLTATRDVSAWIDGTEIRLSKGQRFEGTRKAAEHLAALGLLAEPKPQKKGSKE